MNETKKLIMNQIEKLIFRVSSADTFEGRYPEYNKFDKKTHVLFLNPILSGGVEMYRCIAPYYALNSLRNSSSQPSHAAIIIPFFSDKPLNEKYLSHLENDINKLILWADYCILPTVKSPIQELIYWFKSKNKNIRFGYEIDDSYEHMPETFPQREKMASKDVLHTIRTNIQFCDMLISPSKKILEFYSSFINIKKIFLPNLLSEKFIGKEIFTEALQHRQNDDDNRLVRIGMVVTRRHYEDVLWFRNVLCDMFTKLPSEKFKLVVLGWRGDSTMYANPFQGFEDRIEFHNDVGFTHYFEKLVALKLDIGLIPLRQNIPYNHYKSWQRYLEFSALAIPVICGNSPVYQPLITSEECGYIAHTKDDWMRCITGLVHNAAQRRLIGLTTAHVALMDYFWENAKEYREALAQSFTKSFTTEKQAVE